MHLTKIALIVEYDGTGYHGFQVQRQSPTIQEELERAIHRLTGERLRVRCASRTDAGVHAKGQVVSFQTDAAHPEETWIRALNYYLPQAVSVLSVHTIPCDYDIRKRAVSRHYRYVILNRPVSSPLLRQRAHWVRQPLDVELSNRAASTLVGERDFAPFSGPLPSKKASTIRGLTQAEFHRDGDLVHFEVAGNSFLPQQVRRMTGSLVDVGLKKKSLSEFEATANCQKRGAAGPTLPPHGLFLQSVKYRDFPAGMQTEN